MESLNDVGSITYFNADGSIHETVTFNNQERYLEEAKEALKTRGITGWKCNTLSKDLNLHYELYKMIADEVDDDAMSRGEYARQHPELQKTEEIERTTQAAIRTDSKYQQAEQRRPKVSNLTNAIKEKISITEYAAMLGYHVKQISSDRYTLLEHDSMAIKFDKSGMEYFIWNSRGIGGSVIDFAMAIHDVDKETAIKTLRNYLHSRTPEQIDDTNRRKKIQAAHSMKPKSLEMPPPCEGAFRKVYAYLSKSRGIEAEIVSSLMKNRQLYQDERGNAVFVGFDYDGREKYAFKRSSNTNIPYRGEATGSNKSVGFSMGLVDRTPRRLFVTEAAIDALSLKSLMLIHGIDDSDCAYLACGGTASNALLYHIIRGKEHPDVPWNHYPVSYYTATISKGEWQMSICPIEKLIQFDLLDDCIHTPAGYYHFYRYYPPNTDIMTEEEKKAEIEQMTQLFDTLAREIAIFATDKIEDMSEIKRFYKNLAPEYDHLTSDIIAAIESTESRNSAAVQRAFYFIIRTDKQEESVYNQIAGKGYHINKAQREELAVLLRNYYLREFISAEIYTLEKELKQDVKLRKKIEKKPELFQKELQRRLLPHSMEFFPSFAVQNGTYRSTMMLKNFPFEIGSCCLLQTACMRGTSFMMRLSGGAGNITNNNRS